MPEFPFLLPDGRAACISGNLTEMQAALAIILLELTLEMGSDVLDMTDEIRAEIRYRLVARGYDIETGERTLN